MNNEYYTGLKREHQDHTPVQGAAATVGPVNKKGSRLIVADVLPRGKENAVSAEVLCNRLGFETVRELQKEVARERAAGAVILFACQEDGGYFLPGNVREVRAFIKTLESRGKNTLMALKSARELLRQWGTSSEMEIDKWKET
ncbi:hypothetical protein [Enterocloster citroniae]